MKYSLFKLSILAFCCVGLTCGNVYGVESSNSSTTTSVLSVADKNKAEGEAFLTVNKTKPGVVTLPDGLQYKIIKKGTGNKPNESDTVTVHYVGTLINGTEFDSSYKRNEPASFPVNGVISGWTEALKLMPVGSTWELYIPSKLAYGEQGASDLIGPNQTLIFKVTLLGINKSS